VIWSTWISVMRWREKVKRWSSIRAMLKGMEWPVPILILYLSSIVMGCVPLLILKRVCFLCRHLRGWNLRINLRYFLRRLKSRFKKTKGKSTLKMRNSTRTIKNLSSTLRKRFESSARKVKLNMKTQKEIL